jgi:hypothetical protein
LTDIKISQLSIDSYFQLTIMADDKHLAYGDYQGHSAQDSESTDRGFISDTFKRFQPGGDGVASFFNKVHGAVQELRSEFSDKLPSQLPGQSSQHQHRFGSFVAPTQGNDAKWYVDGCGYFWGESQIKCDQFPR